MKSAQVSPSTFLCWDFEDRSLDKLENEMQFYLPKFVRVHEITGIKEDNQCFFPCDCYERQRIGCPCKCFYEIAASADVPIDKRTEIGMFDIRMLKIFNSHYGELEDDGRNTEIANKLYDAQHQSFMNEG